MNFLDRFIGALTNRNSAIMHEPRRQPENVELMYAAFARKLFKMRDVIEAYLGIEEEDEEVRIKYLDATSRGWEMAHYNYLYTSTNDTHTKVKAAIKCLKNMDELVYWANLCGMYGLPNEVRRERKAEDDRENIIKEAVDNAPYSRDN